ncbi:LuxR C-terminal-related transcriptional regulator [Umezawaea endophytica]|uniref:LuxR C-terminal-related transcriptional regulator n=1 Tax=Umezawaea endophytica TaxID=1654476 RepID=A0A9X2VHA8_9PSEU|nr:LuxR C-terminal-related transcriptional regulator [Umezawaea endophytica]MCS7476404.1 LuxR C-terminal-related transcriptional regulator [Umezawaea endophytica]
MGASVSSGHVGTLPASTTGLTGRKQDSAEVKRLLAKARLVTLTGVAGVGKTRLSLRVAADLRRAFADGVWFVELAHIVDADLLAHTVVEALGARDGTGRDQTAVLVAHLRDRQALLVLDGCEHLLDAVADLAGTLLRAAPGLRLLVTSRERLDVEGEHLWRVAPLALPDPQRPERGTRYAALDLFADRAAAVVPDFALTPDNELLVAEICHLLGGIPLAIELAAVLLRLLPLEHLRDGLHDTYRVLAAGRRGGLPRHQTLSAAVEWSYALCTEQEQSLWRRVSVFSGSFGLEAAEDVCDGDLEVLGALADKSVLIVEQGVDGVRFRLLEPLRQFGRDRLRAVDEEESLRRKHRDHFVALAERGEREWFGPDQPDVQDRTRLDHANLRVALDHCLGSPEEHLAGLHLVGTLWFYWAGCGALGEGRRWVDRVLALDTGPGRRRAKVLWVGGYLATLQGDLDAAVSMLEECREYAEEAGDESALAYSTHRLACTMLVGDDLDRAAGLFEEALASYRRLGLFDSNVLLARVELGIVAVFRADFELAASLCEEARDLGERYGEQWATAYATWVLAMCAFVRGDWDRSEALARECLRVKRTFDDLLGMVLAIEVLAWSAAGRGAAERAATLLGAAHRIWQSVGYPMFGSRHFGAPHGDCERAAIDVLGDRAFGRALRRGMAFGLAEAVRFALEEPVLAVVEEAPTPLTRREQEVADLVAGGLSNKDIAVRLVIARRTAEGHVERILQKLGFSSRTQIANWIAERARVAGG